jgi:hypothetical protein
MQLNQQSEMGTLKLSVRRSPESEYLELAAEQIRHLPSVLRVDADPAFGNLEIIFRQPTQGLLRQIHTALQSARCTVVAGRMS